MLYTVELIDGSTLGPGPADVLSEWVREGRIGPADIAVGEDGVRVQVRDVPSIGELPRAVVGPVDPFGIVQRALASGAGNEVVSASTVGGDTVDEAAPAPEPPPVVVYSTYIPPSWERPPSPVTSPPPRRAALWVITLAVFAVPVFFLIVVPSVENLQRAAATSSPRVAAIANAKLLAEAAILYADDNDNRLPPNMSSAAAARPFIGRYFPRDEMVDVASPVGSVFLGNRFLAGVDASRIEDPQSVVMFYENLDWSDGTRPVSYADGHAGWMRHFDELRDVRKPLLRR